MTRILWVFAILAVSVWTLFAWGLYGLINFFGDTAARNADVVVSNPTGVEWLSWGLSAMRNVGLAAVIFVWGLVSVVILGVPALLSLALGTLGRGRLTEQGPVSWPSQAQWSSSEPRPGYRDVTPEKSSSSNDDNRLIERR